MKHKKRLTEKKEIDALFVRCAFEAGWTDSKKSEETLMSSPCPSENDLAALVDNRLDEMRRSQLFEHLDLCPKCYNEWLRLTATKPSLLYRIKLNLVMRIRSLLRPICSRWKKQKQGLNVKNVYEIERDRFFIFGKGISWCHAGAWQAGFGIAMACVLLFFIYNNAIEPPSQRSSLTAMIEISQKEMLSHFDRMGGQSKRDLIPPPWEQAVQRYGFARKGLESDIGEERFRNAFSTGVWHAKQSFESKKKIGLKESDLKEMADAANYDFGRWCYLLRTAGLSSSMLSSTFWKRQYIISEAYLTQYQNHLFAVNRTGGNTVTTDPLPIDTATGLPWTFHQYLTSKIETLNQLLKNSETEDISYKTCRHIAGEANAIIKFVVE